MIRALHGLRRFGRRYAGDRRGVSAVEFAFIAPLLIVFYFGMAETCQLLIVKRKVSHAGAAVADLVSRHAAVSISKNELDGLMAATRTVIYPLPTDQMTLRLMSVSKGSGTTPQTTVDWSYPAGGLARGATYAPSTPLNAGESVIVATVSYDFTSALGYFIPGVKVLTHKAELRPRKQEKIACPAADCP